MQLWSDLLTTLVVIDIIPFGVLLIVVTLRPINQGFIMCYKSGPLVWFFNQLNNRIFIPVLKL